MMSNSSSNVDEPVEDVNMAIVNMAIANTPVVSPRRGNVSTSTSPSAKPTEDQDEFGVDGSGDPRSSPVKMQSTSAGGPMRTQRKGAAGYKHLTKRYDPLARPAAKKQGETSKQTCSDGCHHDKDDAEEEDTLSDVDASVDDLVAADPDAATNHPWTDIPGLIDDVKAIACLQSTLRAIHQDTEEGLKFLTREMKFE
ncbi:hypothetical protein F4781DRAFT_399637 [Annulohypoxylon bovei var. microspora]|nr:hypothetical protein F4781DRAFT_399637 [Annulohypoxylon bovei var. microspora]